MEQNIPWSEINLIKKHFSTKCKVIGGIPKHQFGQISSSILYFSTDVSSHDVIKHVVHLTQVVSNFCFSAYIDAALGGREFKIFMLFHHLIECWNLVSMCIVSFFRMLHVGTAFFS